MDSNQKLASNDDRHVSLNRPCDIDNLLDYESKGNLETAMSTGKPRRSTDRKEETPLVDNDVDTQAKETTWFVCRRWRIAKKLYIQICLGLLLASLFFERFFFITTVYKTKFYGYVLILMVIGLNSLFNMVLYRMLEEKQTKKLH